MKRSPAPPSSAGRELDHVEQGFEMGAREDEPPAIGPDPLDDPDQVALVVAAVAQRSGLVAEHERAEEDHPPAIVRKDRADRALRAGQLGELKPPALQRDPAAEGG